MYNFETEMLVHETKGLLEGLEDQIRRVKFNLAFDNLNDLILELNTMRMTIDRMETNVKRHIKNNEN